jgi:hypothetical protein
VPLRPLSTAETVKPFYIRLDLVMVRYATLTHVILYARARPTVCRPRPKGSKLLPITVDSERNEYKLAKMLRLEAVLIIAQVFRTHFESAAFGGLAWMVDEEIDAKFLHLLV